jgi:hypothetical protein
MTFFLIIVSIFTFLLCIELFARIHYYLRKKEFPLDERIKFIFFGKWLINDNSSSPLYIDEIARSLQVDTEFMINILSEASGKDASDLKKVFLGSYGRTESYTYNPMIGFVPEPNQYLGHLMINSKGFRGQERSFHKPPHVKRVLILGGSVSYGRTATSEDATIAEQLERKLNERLGGQGHARWEVINLSLPGFISYQELLLLTMTGLKFHPDFVISFSAFNDAHHYLMNRELNTPASLVRVKTAYRAFFGGALTRLLLFLSGYLVSMMYLYYLLSTQGDESDEALSPYMYTIW